MVRPIPELGSLVTRRYVYVHIWNGVAIVARLSSRLLEPKRMAADIAEVNKILACCCRCRPLYGLT